MRGTLEIIMAKLNVTFTSICPLIICKQYHTIDTVVPVSTYMFVIMYLIFREQVKI